MAIEIILELMDAHGNNWSDCSIRVFLLELSWYWCLCNAQLLMPSLGFGIASGDNFGELWIDFKDDLD